MILQIRGWIGPWIDRSPPDWIKSRLELEAFPGVDGRALTRAQPRRRKGHAAVGRAGL